MIWAGRATSSSTFVKGALIGFQTVHLLKLELSSSNKEVFVTETERQKRRVLQAIVDKLKLFQTQNFEI